MKPYWCSRPDHLKMISIELWRNLTQPINECTILNAPYDTLDAFNLTDYFSNATSIELIECKSWEYDMSLIGNTIVSEWSMVCDRLYLGSVVESCFLAGAGLGSVTSGWISDQYGRKHTLMVFAAVQLVTGKSHWDFSNDFRLSSVQFKRAHFDRFISREVSKRAVFHLINSRKPVNRLQRSIAKRAKSYNWFIIINKQNLRLKICEISQQNHEKWFKGQPEPVGTIVD